MTVRVAIIGTGWGTRIQVPAFRQAGLEITALWGRTAEKAATMAAELDIPFSSADPKAVITHENVDLVSIVTPPDTHADWSILALEAGRHVLCEKPTALDAHEAAAMWQAAQAHPNQIALIDHELRFVPTRLRMRQLVAEGYVGEVRHVDATVTASARLDPQRPWNWWASASQGGGILGAIGSHVIDILRFSTNLEVTKATGDLRIVIDQRTAADGYIRPVTADEWAAMLLNFGEAVAGNILLSVVTAGPSSGHTRVAGTAGALVITDGQLMGYRFGQAPEDLTVAENLELPTGIDNSEFSRGTVYIGQALKTAIETGNHSGLAFGATFEDGLRIQQVLDAVRKGHETGTWVSL